MSLGSQKGKLLVILVFFVASIFIYQKVFTKPELKVQILAVTKGEAFLVRVPGGATVLVDTGPDAGVLRELGAALPEWQRRIDVLIVTSTDKNVSGGSLAVLQRYRVARYLTPTTLRRGTRIALGHRAVIDVLTPDRTIVSGSASARAVALRLSYGKTSFLFDGMLAPSITSWFSTLDAASGAWHADVTLASTTPVGVFYSNGQRVEIR